MSSSDSSDCSDDDVDWKRRRRDKSKPLPTATATTCRSSSHGSSSVCDRTAVAASMPDNRQPIASARPGASTGHSQPTSTTPFESREVHPAARSVSEAPRVKAIRSDQNGTGTHDRGSSHQQIEMLRLRVGLSDAVPFQDFAKRVHHFLREPEEKMEFLTSCIKAIGRKNTVRLLADTEETMRTGGLATQNRFRQRSMGGVFFQLMNTDPFISDDVREQLAGLVKDEGKAVAKERRNRKRKREQEASMRRNFVPH